MNKTEEEVGRSSTFSGKEDKMSAPSSLKIVENFVERKEPATNKAERRKIE